MGSTTRGFPFPEPEDPVSEGAAAIEALAQSLKPMQMIEDKLLAAAAADFDFAAIPQGFTHLAMVLSLRSDVAAQATGCYVQFNGDAGANYSHQYRQTTGGSTNSAETFGAAGISWPAICGDTALADFYSAIELWIPCYSLATVRKGLNSRFSTMLGASAGNFRLGDVDGAWHGSYAAINRIRVVPLAGQWKAASRATLYGL